MRFGENYSKKDKEKNKSIQNVRLGFIDINYLSRHIVVEFNLAKTMISLLIIE